MKILIVEDQKDLAQLIEQSLISERYIVEHAASLSSAKEKIAMYDYDCILLDIMLGDGNGLDILQQLKDEGKSNKVIITSAKDSVDDKIKGLELGADDYLPKPFHLAELSARIRSVLRRSNPTKKNLIELANVKIYPDTFKTTVNNKELELLRKEYDILYFFITRPGRLIQKEALAEAIWGDNIDQVDNYDFIYAQIKNLRKKLTRSGAQLELKAVYGFGYKLSTL